MHVFDYSFTYVWTDKSDKIYIGFAKIAGPNIFFEFPFAVKPRIKSARNADEKVKMVTDKSLFH